VFGELLDDFSPEELEANADEFVRFGNVVEVSPKVLEDCIYEMQSQDPQYKNE